jgi:hypothetical protein
MRARILTCGRHPLEGPPSRPAYLYEPDLSDAFTGPHVLGCPTSVRAKCDFRILQIETVGSVSEQNANRTTRPTSVVKRPLRHVQSLVQAYRNIAVANYLVIVK